MCLERYMKEKGQISPLERLRPHWGPLMVLGMLCVLVYGRLVGHDFILNWDDAAYVVNVPEIRGLSLEHLRQVLSNSYVGNYAPVHMISYMLDYELWGLWPGGFLLTNLVIHLLNGLLLYRLLLKYHPERMAAWAGAALFLLHPVQVETVAWVSQRKTLLAMLFFLLAWEGWCRYRDAESGAGHRSYLFAVSLFVLALLSKSVAVILPVVLIGDQFLFRRERHLKWRENLPFFAAALAVSILALITQQKQLGGGRVVYTDDYLQKLVFTMPVVLVEYFKLLFLPLPSRFSIIYGLAGHTTLDLVSGLGLVIVAVLLLTGVVLYRKRSRALFWYLLFFAGLLPVSQLVPLLTLMNDRYLYFPMLGLSGLVALLWSLGSGHVQSAPIRSGFGVATAAIVAALSVSAAIRVRVWQNPVTLFQSAAARYPDQPKMWAKLAESYFARGDIEHARLGYEKAAQVGLLDNEDLSILIPIYLERGDLNAAYRNIWNLDKSNKRTLFLGEYYFRRGEPAQAERYLAEYLTNSPSAIHALYLLGQVRLMSGQYQEAAGLYRRAIDAGGAQAGIYFSMSCAELYQNRLDQARESLGQALQLGLSARELQGDDPCLRKMRQEPALRTIMSEAR